MSLRFPDSMDEVIYFTRRLIGLKGKVVCWVFKEDCPKCKKAKMGKPKENGKVKIRAKEYVCPSCKYTVEKVAYEDTLTASIQYTCPKCGNAGELEAPFKRKSIEGVKTIRVQCQKCKANIDITKKMKSPKKKGGEDMDEDE
ncbi:MAG: hypothetical protein V1743_01450 [Nanoarchaeota archaeon]